jgi:hypothetical protein
VAVSNDVFAVLLGGGVAVGEAMAGYQTRYSVVRGAFSSVSETEREVYPTGNGPAPVRSGRDADAVADAEAVGCGV